MTTVYDVYVDADPQTITAVGLEIYAEWVKFALGMSSLGGKRLMHPTGKYASSIQFKKTGVASVAVFTDDGMAPEAEILEAGHAAIDLKKYLVPGKAYPMHRGSKGQYGSAGYGAPVFSTAAGSRAANVWAKPRARGRSGIARVPSKITAENASSWVIPPMPMYSPAKHLADLIRNSKGQFKSYL